MLAERRHLRFIWAEFMSGSGHYLVWLLLLWRRSFHKFPASYFPINSAARHRQGQRWTGQARGHADSSTGRQQRRWQQTVWRTIRQRDRQSDRRTDRQTEGKALRQIANKTLGAVLLELLGAAVGSSCQDADDAEAASRSHKMSSLGKNLWGGEGQDVGRKANAHHEASTCPRRFVLWDAI